MNTHYPALKVLKSPKAGNLLDVLIDAICCMNGRKMIMLFIDRKEKQKTEKEKALQDKFVTQFGKFKKLSVQ